MYISVLWWRLKTRSTLRNCVKSSDVTFWTLPLGLYYYGTLLWDDKGALKTPCLTAPVGVERGWMGWTGVEWGGMGWNGVEWGGMGWTPMKNQEKSITPAKSWIYPKKIQNLVSTPMVSWEMWISINCGHPKGFLGASLAPQSQKTNWEAPWRIITLRILPQEKSLIEMHPIQDFSDQGPPRWNIRPPLGQWDRVLRGSRFYRPP